MVGLSQLRMEENKVVIITLLQSTARDGIDRLISYLEKHDYFTAPASTKYHLSVPGGLAQHSLNVYFNLMRLYYGEDWRSLEEYTERADGVEHSNIVIAALLHDLCKVDFYKSVLRNVKEDGAWKEVSQYVVDEQMKILGHGSKSVIVAQQFIRLYFAEIQAISFHMGMSDPDASFAATISEVYDEVKLARYLHMADFWATYEHDVACLEEGSAQDSDDVPF